jgi:endonuclease/exonuclease/phosphatase family metal-dependent hydrolase
VLLRVMTFNVRGAFHEDGINNWANRRDLNVATILKYAPDIIGFQEAQSGNLEAYEVALTDYASKLGLISIRQEENYHRVPIYWKRDRFTKLDSGGFYLSLTPAEWSLSWGSSLVRAVTWVKLRESNSDFVFVVLTTHFPHEPEADLARDESARLVVRQLAQVCPPDAPQIVMADFNALPGSAAYQVFSADGYSDTCNAAPEWGETSTFHGFQGAAFPHSGFRIDWILTKTGARQITTKHHLVVTDAEPPLYPSDHYPVLADLEIN